MKKLDDDNFIRAKLYSDTSAVSRYMQLTLGQSSWFKLIRYEILTGFFGSIPGALGLMLRKMLYPYLFHKIGKGVVFGRHLTLRHPDKITIGDGVVIDDYAVIDGRGAGDQGLTIGASTIVNRGVVIQSKVGPISIGRDCSIGAGTVIISQGGIIIENGVQIGGCCEITGGLFKLNPDRTGALPFDRFTKKPIIIREATMMGVNVIILDGVEVGRSCLLGAGSILTVDLADYSVFSPRPGMVIGRTVKTLKPTPKLD